MSFTEEASIACAEVRKEIKLKKMHSAEHMASSSLQPLLSECQAQNCNSPDHIQHIQADSCLYAHLFKLFFIFSLGQV